MPRIRKITEEPVVTYSVLDREISQNDFLNNPDLFKDSLPQPYRRIDKVLQEIFEDVWNIIEKNDNERKIEQSKPKAPKYSSVSVLEGLDNFNCMCTSSDYNNDFIFVGSNGSIYCIDVSCMTVVDKFDFDLQNQDNNTNIISISSSKIKQSTHLIASISDTGYLFLNMFVIDKFYSIQNLIVDSDAERKFLYRKCELSKNSDHIALFTESKLNPSDCLIEIYKCPKDLWIQTIENNDSKSKLKLNEQTSNEIGSSENLVNDLSLENKQQINLTKPNLLCKLKPPSNHFKFQAANLNNLTSLFKTIDANSDQIGLGINNCISKSHLDIKSQLAEKIFKLKLSEDALCQLNGSKNYDLSLFKLNADFKFLPSNRIVPSTSSQIDHQNETPVSVVVCWNNSNQLIFYSLCKISKELEAKIEYSMPFSSQITNIQMTNCNNLIAICLKNNNIIVFDLNFGIERKCVNINNCESIEQMFFLPISNQNKSLYINGSPQFNIETNLACLTSNGVLYTIDCTLGIQQTQTPKLVFMPILANKDDKLVQILPCKTLPNLLLVVGETKKVFILNLETGKLMCELDNNVDKFILDNVNYEMCFCSKNQQIFLKCVTVTNDQQSKLLCHSLKLIPILENHLNVFYPILTNCLPLNASLNDRVKTILKKHIDEQVNRKERLKNIWSELNNQRNVTKLTNI